MARSKPRVGGPASGIPASGIPAGGDGWGGPAKGRGNKGPGPGHPKGMKPGEGKKTVADLLIASGVQRLTAERWIAILNDVNHPRHADMVVKAAERMDGQPKQDVEVIQRGIISAEPLTEDEWLDRYGGLVSPGRAAKGAH